MRKLYASIWLLFCALTLYAQKSNAQEKQAIAPKPNNPTIKIENSFETEAKDPYFNYTTVNKVIHPAYARTGKASLLLHSKNSYSIIHSKLIPIRKNSTVSLKVQALYPQKGNFITKALAIAGASASAFQANKYLTPIAQSENQKGINRKLYPTFGFGLALAPELLKGRTKEVPKAYLRCLVYDKDTNLVDSQIKLLDKTAKNNWQELALNTKALKDGYLQVTVVNESKKDVLVDDLSINITKDKKEEEEIIITPVQSFEAARTFSGSIANTMNVQSNGECSPIDGGSFDTVDVPRCSQEEICDPNDERCYDPQACIEGGGSGGDGGNDSDNDPNSCTNDPFQCQCDVFWCNNSGGDGGGNEGGGGDIDGPGAGPIDPIDPNPPIPQPPLPPIPPPPSRTLDLSRVQQSTIYNCVFASMEMISDFLGCPDSLNQNFYSNLYETEFPNDWNGVKSTDVTKFATNHFISNSLAFGGNGGANNSDFFFEGVVKSINLGDPVLSVYTTTGENSSDVQMHAVVIYGYTNEGKLLVKDPFGSITEWRNEQMNNHVTSIGISSAKCK